MSEKVTTQQFNAVCRAEDNNTIQRIYGTTKQAATGGYCARGVGNILEALGVPFTFGDAHTWDTSLPKNGWTKLEGVTPENAPPGAVLVFDRNPPGSRNGGGSSFGHVEIVTEVNGNRQYISDKSRDNFGGTVKGNFVGVYIHPKMSQLAENVPSGFARDRLQTTLDQEERRRRDDGTLTDDFRSGYQSQIDGLDLENLNLFGLLAMIFNLISGKPLDAPLETQPQNPDGSDVGSAPAPEEATPSVSEPSSEQPSQATPENEPTVSYTPPAGSPVAP